MNILAWFGGAAVMGLVLLLCRWVNRRQQDWREWNAVVRRARQGLERE